MQAVCQQAVFSIIIPPDEFVLAPVTDSRQLCWPRTFSSPKKAKMIASLKSIS
jgi:hypothetical protein